MSAQPPRTADHAEPERPNDAAGQPALVCVYPRSHAVPVPDGRAPVGRDWLAANDLADPEVSGAHIELTRLRGRTW